MQSQRDLTILGHIMTRITLQEWRQCQLNHVKFRKSRLIDSLDIDNSLLEALAAMREGLNLMAFVSKDRTRLFGCLRMSDLLTHITTHWGVRDTNCFKIQLHNFDLLF